MTEASNRSQTYQTPSALSIHDEWYKKAFVLSFGSHSFCLGLVNAPDMVSGPNSRFAHAVSRTKSAESNTRLGCLPCNRTCPRLEIGKPTRTVFRQSRPRSTSSNVVVHKAPIASMWTCIISTHCRAFRTIVLQRRCASSYFQPPPNTMDLKNVARGSRAAVGRCMRVASCPPTRPTTIGKRLRCTSFVSLAQEKYCFLFISTSAALVQQRWLFQMPPQRMSVQHLAGLFQRRCCLVGERRATYAHAKCWVMRSIPERCACRPR